MLAPTLIVGLGGKGSDIVQRVSKLASDKQRKSISFVVFDTDVNELREIREKDEFISTIQTSTKLSVGEYLNIDTHARDNWFPVNKILSRKTLTEGAGQVRAISRLALDTAIRAGHMEPLHEAIEELYKLTGENMQQALRVIIVSSLAGGTGSGLILPVSMYIKNFLTTRFQQSASIMRGFFILPEVFYEVIAGQAERNNLKCNAYATLRELDSFLMKGDGTLPDKYKNLKFEFPRVGSQECDNYEVMPFDFCFLFDAQNVDGKKLNSFNEYLDHAANCIYAQSISPMNKRSNSSEDNVIRELCKSGGRNRYCGAGSSMLLYPFADIKNYIALLWARDSVSKEWLEIDIAFKKTSIENQNMRNKGYAVKPIDKKEFYIESVNSAYAAKKPFATVIRNSCCNFDENGIIEIGYKWDDYIDNLRAFVETNATNNQESIDFIEQQCQGHFTCIAQENPDEDAYINLYTQILTYKGLVIKRTESSSRTMAYTIFNSNSEAIKDNAKHVLENYLKDSSGNIIHPNAARYFLYNVLSRLEKELANSNDVIKDITEFWDNFDKKFDDAETPEKETASDFANTKLKKNIIQIVLKLKSANEQMFIDENKKLFNKITEYRIESVYLEVIKAAISYVNSICESYNGFYNSFEKSVEKLTTEIDNIYTRYSNDDGHAIRYVCASSKSLDKFSDKAVFTGNFLDLPGELCNEIYSQIRKYAMLDEKPDDDSFFVDIFDKAIMNYFKTSVMQNYGQLLDMDILEALETEAEFEKGIYDKKKRGAYVANVIKETNILAQPFIEAPLGEQRRIIDACAFNKKMVEDASLERKDLINSELFNNGGVADNDIEKYMIIFYKAIYSLRANDLSKFAPPAHTMTVNREGGDYYKAYFELISQIKPEAHRTAVITPHIDRSWHLVSNLPDLDETSQAETEHRIYTALFYGLISGKIEYKNVAPEKNIYRLQLSGNSDDFVVSNQTPCDNFYEVLDALTINPLIVNDILNLCEEEIQEERLGKCSFEDGLLYKQLKNFKLLEFSDEIRSIFDISLLLKKSKPVSEYSEQEAVDILESLLENCKSYMLTFFKEEEVNYRFGNFISEQYEIFKNNLRSLSSEWAGVESDTLVDKILNTTAYMLKKLGIGNIADSILEENRKNAEVLLTKNK